MRLRAPFTIVARFTLVVGIVAAFAASASAQTAITTCGQEVTGATTLPADLDCTGVSGNAVTVHGGTVAMNGHTITGGDIGIYCDSHCKIIGPGLVTGAKYFGIDAFNTGVRTLQVDSTNNGLYGVQSWKRTSLVGPATISGNGAGVVSSGKVKLVGVTIENNQTTAMSVADNKHHAALLMINSNVTGNGRGVFADRGKLVESTITGNGTFGVYVGLGRDRFDCLSHPPRLVLKASTVTGNDTDPSCSPTNICPDLETCGAAPILKLGSSCDHSYALGSNPPDTWHVCSLD